MKNMIKRVSLILCLLFTLSFLLYGCGIDNKSPATIKLIVDSPYPAEEITVTSSRGSVTNQGKTYTIMLTNRHKTLVSVSAYGLKTQTVAFSALDFKSADEIERIVELKSNQESIIQLTFKCDSKVEFKLADGNDDVAITSKGNKYTLLSPTRDEERIYNFTASAEGMETYSGSILGENVINGLLTETVKLVPPNKRVVEVKSNGSNSFISKNLNLIYGEEKVSTSGNNMRNDTYFYLLDSDDEVLLSFDKKAYIIGSEIPVYGTKLDLSSPYTSGEIPSQKYMKLYFDYNDHYDFRCYFYVKNDDNSFSQVYSQQEYNGNDQTKRKSFLIPEKSGELHLVNWDSQMLTFKYVFTKEVVAATQANSMRVKEFNDPANININYLILDYDYTTTKTASTNMHYDFFQKDLNGYVELDENELNGYQSIMSGYVYDGTELTYNNYYSEQLELLFSLDLNGATLEDINFSSGYRDIEVKKEEELYRVKKVYFDKNNLIIINTNNKNFSNDELTFKRSDLSETGTEGVYISSRAKKLKNFYSFNLYRLERFDYLEYFDRKYEYIGLNSPNAILVNSEDVGAKILANSGENYFSLNAKFKIRLTFQVSNNDCSGNIIMETVDALTVNDLKVLDGLIGGDNSGNMPKLPFKLTIISNNVQDHNRW